MDMVNGRIVGQLKTRRNYFLVFRPTTWPIEIKRPTSERGASWAKIQHLSLNENIAEQVLETRQKNIELQFSE